MQTKVMLENGKFSGAIVFIFVFSLRPLLCSAMFSTISWLDDISIIYYQ